ncbi:hypothetical protein TorRG33x02_057840 [Trema orientale]|uniref:Uncharacterized protein n=1 Tax=Trema orientale TaxID=63057 RepID=A0A2P5FL78_TREOI|nr:hypothetical protein TorRG33x02_057840 [Trema orientale]
MGKTCSTMELKVEFNGQSHFLCPLVTERNGQVKNILFVHFDLSYIGEGAFLGRMCSDRPKSFVLLIVVDMSTLWI